MGAALLTHPLSGELRLTVDGLWFRAKRTEMGRRSRSWLTWKAQFQ